jgi:hypothetical protein
MRKLLLSLLFLLSATTGFCEEKISEAKLTLKLPNNKWELKNKVEQNEAQIYIYKREPIINDDGREVISNIAVIVEDINEDSDVVTYSVFKRSQVGFEVLEVFTPGDGLLFFQNAIGYKGKYKDQHGEHTIYCLYAINNNKGVQIIFDVLTDLFNELDTEFQLTLKSIKNEE